MIEKRYNFSGGDRPFAVELHMLGCDCPACEPYVPSVPPRLDGRAIAWRCIAGFAAGTAMAAALEGPRAVLGVLRDTLAWWLL